MTIEDVRTAGVAGSGTMGFGIALNFALAGIDVIVRDVTDEALRESERRSEDALRLFVEEDLVTEEEANEAKERIDRTTDLERLSGCDFVTEAIIERLPDKQELFCRLDEMCAAHTVLVSNTSGFVISDIGKDVKRQEKLGLTHYFAPAHIVPGVEVAKGPGTTDETYELICGVMEQTGRVPIRLLKEKPGYLLNRIQWAAGVEASRLWAEGMASAEDIELGIQTTFGFRYPHEGPFLHYDLAGIWKWAPGVKIETPAERDPEVIADLDAKIAARAEERQPWFVDPDQFESALEKRDREFIQRLKQLYPRKSST